MAKRETNDFFLAQLFGPPIAGHETSKLPQHGFARSTRWEYLGKTSSESTTLSGSGGDSSVKLDFGLSDSMLPAETRTAWNHKFNLTYSITLSTEDLETTLVVRNVETTPWDFKVLFHTYLQINVWLRMIHRSVAKLANAFSRTSRQSVLQV